jgi:hypothetical protein
MYEKEVRYFYAFQYVRITHSTRSMRGNVCWIVITLHVEGTLQNL